MTNNYKRYSFKSQLIQIFIEMLIWYSPTQNFQHFLRIQLEYFANFNFFLKKMRAID